MNRIVKSTRDGSGGSRNKPSYSAGRRNSPSRRTSTRGGGGGSGSAGGSGKRKRKYQGKSHSGKKDDKKDSAKKDDTGEAKPLSFAAAFAQGVFSWLALSMVARAGLVVTNALSVAASPIAGRIARCLSAWQVITKDKWVLKVVREGYRLQFKSRLPPTPHRVAIPMLLALQYWIMR